MAHQILSETAASISELKRNPMGTVAAGEGFPVAILNRNEPAFYCVPAKIYAAMLERLEDELEKALASGSDAETLHTQIVSLLGSGKDEARSVLAALGWQTVEVAGAKPVWRRVKERRPRRHEPRARPKRPEPPPDPNSPFAGLAALRLR